MKKNCLKKNFSNLILWINNIYNGIQNTEKTMNYNKLSSILPKEIFPELEGIVINFKLDNPLRLSHFLSQAMHESANFKFTTENLNYSEDALKRVFKKYFPGDTAKEYARQPERIANKVYANRMGNGDENSGDGWKYRGRGYIQLTGKFNYDKLSKDLKMDFVKYPELVATPKYALLSAAWFFTKNNIHIISDKGSNLEVIREVTKRVNGGFNGLEDRIKYFNIVYPLLST